MDLIARRVGRAPEDVRRTNLVKSFPYTAATGAYLDSGDYVKCFNSLASTIDVEGFRMRPSQAA